MSDIKNICVYCGSSFGNDPIYASAAKAFGVALAKEKIGLVFGGGSHGLMGSIARAALDNGGHVFGVIPDFLNATEVAVSDLSELQIVSDMHTRKRIMFEKADAFVALPGGIGTLEELAEQLTLIRLRQHAKPLVIVDIGGFWRPLLLLIAHMRNAGFIQPEYELHYLVAERIEDVIPMIRSALHRAPSRISL